MTQLQAVVFDWGGTLTPWHTLDLADLWLAAARVLAPDGAEPLAAALVQVEREFWQRSAATRGAHSLRLADILHLAAARTGVDIEDGLRHSALGAYLEAWTPHTFAQPDAGDVLCQLRAKGLRIGLLSNTHWPPEWHERILHRDGLLALIDARVYTSELAHTKPHREAFQAIITRLAVEPQHAVMVGDRPIDDIAGALAIGMRTVLLPNAAVPAGLVEPDATITTLSDLLPIIDQWMVVSARA
jgi:putative hydrolase of the HAD superfamily